MGQIFSAHDKVIASNISSKSAKDSFFVCEKHCAILSRSWQLVDAYGPEKIGITMFTGLFKNHPEAFRMFPSFRDEPDWATSSPFIHHCRVVVAVIGSSIKTLKTPQILCPHLQFLGTQHSVRGITLVHMECLGNEFIKALEGALSPMGPSKWNDEIKIAWKDLFDSIAAMISKHMGLEEAKEHADLLETLVREQQSAPKDHQAFITPSFKKENQSSVHTPNKEHHASDTPSVHTPNKDDPASDTHVYMHHMHRIHVPHTLPHT